MDCYACENQAARECSRCTRAYCELHGGDLCAECLAPASALPSFNLYRGSLLALLIGTAISLWLIVRPPDSGGGEEVVLIDRTPAVEETVRASATPRTPTQPTPRATATQGPSATPPPPTPSATLTPGPVIHSVAPGQTLSSIADLYGTTAAAIAQANGIAVDAVLSLGQRLIIP